MPPYWISLNDRQPIPQAFAHSLIHSFTHSSIHSATVPGLGIQWEQDRQNVGVYIWGAWGWGSQTIRKKETQQKKTHGPKNIKQGNFLESHKGAGQSGKGLPGGDIWNELEQWEVGEPWEGQAWHRQATAGDEIRALGARGLRACGEEDTWPSTGYWGARGKGCKQPSSCQQLFSSPAGWGTEKTPLEVSYFLGAPSLRRQKWCLTQLWKNSGLALRLWFYTKALGEGEISVSRSSQRISWRWG